MTLKERAQFTHMLEDLMSKINMYFWLSIPLASTKITHVFPVPAETHRQFEHRVPTSPHT